jgi:hypothetical protein
MIRRHICLIMILAFVPVLSTAMASAQSFSPTSGTDAQSLGRGGTSIAAPAGKSSTFGNPATLTREGFFSVGAEYLRTRGTEEGTWVLSLVDTSSSVRGSLEYYTDPRFAGFEKNLWGVALAQTITPYLTLGESYHMGDYDPGTGKSKDLAAADLGILINIGARVSLGYVARNVYRSDNDLLDRSAGFGAALRLPWTILVVTDYEEMPFFDNKYDIRTGLQFRPLGWLTGRLGFQELADERTYYTAGLSYSDVNGTIDAAVLYNKDTRKMDQIVFGFSMKM